MGSPKIVYSNFLSLSEIAGNIKLTLQQHILILNPMKIWNDYLIILYNISKSNIFRVGKIKSGFIVCNKCL